MTYFPVEYMEKPITCKILEEKKTYFEKCYRFIKINSLSLSKKAKLNAGNSIKVDQATLYSFTDKIRKVQTMLINFYKFKASISVLSTQNRPKKFEKMLLKTKMVMTKFAPFAQKQLAQMRKNLNSLQGPSNSIVLPPLEQEQKISAASPQSIGGGPLYTPT